MPEKHAIVASSLRKGFTLHHLGPAKITALDGVSLSAPFGTCLAVNGPSGCGKSTLLRCLYGNYRIQGGSILIAHKGGYLDLALASEREILELRRHTVSYVSQFLRVIPRVPALDIVAEPLISQGVPKPRALARAQSALARLGVPERLWSLPPLTFSGGERQRVNIARGLIRESPILLLDEPTASLDRANRETVASLIVEAKERGAAIVGVFHDREVRDLVADKTLELGSDAAAESPPADGGETSEKGSVALSAEDGESPQDAPKLSGGGRRA